MEGSSPSELAAELAALRARVAQLELELVEQASSANAKLAELQRQAYWLDRLEIDLDEALAHPGAAFAATYATKVVRRLRRVSRRVRRRPR